MDVSFGVMNDALVRAAMRSAVPLSGQFEITARCNYRCVMCYVNQPAGHDAVKRAELSAAEWLALGRQARDAGMLNVLLTGGEPLIRNDFLEIYEGFHDLGLVMTLYTNASLVTDTLAERLAKRKPHAVYVSLYGTDDAVSDRVTGIPGSYSATMKGVAHLMAHHVPVILRTTLVRDNVHQLADMAEIAFRLKVPFGMNDLVFSRREDGVAVVDGVAVADGNVAVTDWRVSPEQSREALEAYMRRMAGWDGTEMSEDLTESMRPQNEPPILIDEADEGMSRRFVETGSAFRCSAGKISFWITWHGKMTPCASLAMPSVDVRGKPFAACWEALRKGCAEVPVCEACQACPHLEECDTCPAYCFVENGRFDMPPKFLCERFGL